MGFLCFDKKFLKILKNLQLSNIWTIFINKVIQCVLLMCGFAAAVVLRIVW